MDQEDIGRRRKVYVLDDAALGEVLKRGLPDLPLDAGIGSMGWLENGQFGVGVASASFPVVPEGAQVEIVEAGKIPTNSAVRIPVGASREELVEGRERINERLYDLERGKA